MSTSESRKNTPEYDRVRTNLSHITKALVANRSGMAQLRLMFMEKEWLDISANPTPQELVLLALRRIKENAAQFGLFTAMLCGIPGLDLIAKKLTGTCTRVFLLSYMSIIGREK